MPAPSAAVFLSSRPRLCDTTNPMLIDQAPPPDREPEGSTIHVQVRGPAVPPALAWRLVGDTDWMGRRGGSGHVLEMGIQAAGDGLPVITGALAGPAMTRMPF